MTVYLFDPSKRVRRIIPFSSVTELVHDEANYGLSATIGADMQARNGDHIGFMCVDGHFRLFTITKAEDSDNRRTTSITATDAIVQELKETIIEDHQQLDVGLKDAILGLMAASGTTDTWQVTGTEPERLEKSHAYYNTAWDMMTTYMQLYEWRIIPYYVFTSGQITGRVIHLEKDEAVFRGRILQSGKDASNVYVIRTAAPITRLYGVGKATGTEEEPSNLTIGEASWSVAAGDPVDKPMGQTWVEDEDAVAKYGRHAAIFTLQSAEDAKELMQKTWDHLQKVKKPSCTVEATIQDMEHVHGYEHQIIRLGDLVPIRLTNATMEAARVINIKRDYVSHWLTKVTIGDKTASIQNQVSTLMKDATHTFERLTIYQNRFHEDEALIQMNAQMIQMNAHVIEMNAEEIRANAEKIQLNAKEIEMNADEIRLNANLIEMNAKDIALNAEQITLKAGKEEVNELGQTISAAMIRVDGVEAEIELKASRAEMSEMQTRLSQAEIRIDGAEAAIQLKAERTTVDALATKVTQALIDIDGANAKIDMFAGTLDEFGNRITSAEILVDGMNAKVELKASKQEVDDLDSRISSAEIMIDGLNADIKLVATQKTIDELVERLSQAEIDISGLNAEIKLVATQKTIDELAERVTQAEVAVDGANAAIELKASKQDVQQMEERLAQAEIDIDGANAAIALKAAKQDVEDMGKRLTQAEVDIDGANAAIALKANKTAVDSLITRVSQAEVDINAAESSIEMKASQKSVTDLGDRVSLAEIKISGAESSIELLAEQIRLAGYVTMDQFSALQGQVSNLQGGLSSFTIIRAGTVSATETNTTYLNTSALTFGGYTVSQRAITMGSMTSAGKALATGAIDLSHSHKVTVNSDGTITLGEVATTGGSFKIADTTYYKNGVSAARTEGVNSVTLTNMGWQSGVCTVKASNNKTLNVSLPTFSTSGGTSWSNHKTTVYFSTASVSGPLKSVTVDATSEYNSGVTAGKNDVTITAAGWKSGSNVVSASNGKSVTVSLPTFSTSGGTSWSNHKTTVYFPTASVSGPLKSVTVDATSEYNSGVTAGKNDVTITAAGWKSGSNVVSASNGKSVTVSLPSFSTSGGTSWADNKTTVYFSTPSVSSALKSVTVDATSVYNAGWNECRDACVGERCLINYYPAGETLYDKDGNSAGSNWYKGTVGYLYHLPSAKS